MGKVVKRGDIMKVIKGTRKYMKKKSKGFQSHLVEIPFEEWPEVARSSGRHFKVLRSNKFLVQIFPLKEPCVVRISVCRAELQGSTWKDGISWDELMQIKRECGYKDFDAVEIYPMDEDIINVTNMRHIFVMKDPLEFAWRNST